MFFFFENSDVCNCYFGKEGLLSIFIFPYGDWKKKDLSVLTCLQIIDAANNPGSFNGGTEGDGFGGPGGECPGCGE